MIATIKITKIPNMVLFYSNPLVWKGVVERHVEGPRRFILRKEGQNGSRPLGDGIAKVCFSRPLRNDQGQGQGRLGGLFVRVFQQFSPSYGFRLMILQALSECLWWQSLVQF